MGFLIGSHWKYRPQRSHHHSQPFKALDQSCWRQGNIEELVWADRRDDAEPQIFAATKLHFSSEYSVQSLIGQATSRLSKKFKGNIEDACNCSRRTLGVGKPQDPLTMRNVM